MFKLMSNQRNANERNNEISFYTLSTGNMGELVKPGFGVEVGKEGLP